MKILTAIPCLYNGDTCLKAFRSVIGESDLLILDNGGDESVKQAISIFKGELHPHAVFVFENETNQYVTSAWNFFIEHFLNYSFYDQLIIMNSDLILEPGWSNYLVDGISCIPTDGSHKQDEVVTQGSPGVFLHFNKAMAKLVYPIPNEIKLWYNDFWCYNILRNLGYKTIVRSGIIAQHFHGGSQSIGILPNKSEMIEADKVAWAEIVEPLMNERIKKLKDEHTIER